MPVTWTYDKDKKFFAVAMKISGAKLSEANWNEVAEAMGEGVSKESVYQRYKKVIRPLAETTGTKTAVATPKPSSPTKVTKSPGGSKRAAKESAADEEGGVVQKGVGKGRKKVKVVVAAEEGALAGESQ